MSKITYNCKIEYQNPEDEIKLRNMLKGARDAFNIASDAQFGAKRCIKTLHKAVYRKIRNSFPKIPAIVVVQAERDCLSVYRAINSNHHVLDKPCHKKKLSIRLNKSMCSKKGEWLSVATLDGRIRIKPRLYLIIEKLLNTHEYGDCLIFEKNGIFYLSYTFKILEVPIIETIACGVDLGIRRYAATSEGKIFKDKKYNESKRRIRYIKRRLQSKNTKSAKKHLKQLHCTERNTTKNFVHHLSKHILESTSATIIVVEDLKGIKDKKKRGIPKQAKLKRLAQVSFFMLRQFLTYKAPLYGKRVVTVSPYKTSQMDHRTKRCKKSARQGCRYYSKQGLVFDADVNAAINIARKSKHPISCCKALDGQAIVNSPIVG